MTKPMPSTLTARVIPEKGSEFTAHVANLSTSSLFLLGRETLAFREAVTVKFKDVSVHGEVAFLCREPSGAVVVFRPSPDAIECIEAEMDDVLVVEGGGGPTSLEDLARISDAELDALPESDPEGPTNTEGEPIDVDDEEDATQSAAEEVREAFSRSKFPTNLKTERVENEHILAAKSAVLARRPVDRDPTVVPDRAPLRSQTVLAELDEATVRPAPVEEETLDRALDDQERAPFEERTEPPTMTEEGQDPLEETSEG